MKFWSTRRSAHAPRVASPLRFEALEDRSVPSAADVVTIDPAYREFLGRDIDQTGKVYYAQRLDAGATSAQVALEIQNSDEGQAFKVTDAFAELLGRAPGDRAAGFITGLRQGMTQDQIRAAIAGSDEFFQLKGGGTNAGYLSALYKVALGRDIGSGELATRMAQFQSGVSREQVAREVYASPERATRVVNELYVDLLGRKGESAGVSNWVGQLQSGVRVEVIASRFVASAEYFDLAIRGLLPTNTGPAGPQGPAGPAGATGATGPQGAQGLQGVQGAQGLQGVQGAQGAQGAQGLQGTPGTPGIPGPQGPQGPQGLQGPAGTNGAGVSSSFSAYQLATIADSTVVGGADVPFSNNGAFVSGDVTHTAGTTVFTVTAAGTYRLTATLNYTAGVGAAIAFAVNGVSLPGWTPLLTATGQVVLDTAVTFAPGDVVTLRNNSATPLVMTLAPGAGATLTIDRIS
ncbi:DUF4214 domain-containing protein [Gemmata sp. JC717]|uniref:DUF4214 domain-containing protein n=1 Tax=Gemmata algarum TaxID=2975278 RepID=UPI0021BB645E|nr:DUF4214 domain-containing protein [Gemmata algarum]MDY3557171.1 DUF4214 domain-containing protein [Gemmata algarum]